MLELDQNLTQKNVNLWIWPKYRWIWLKTLLIIGYQKLQWSDHIAYCISKSNKALLAMKLIKRYFNTNELLQLITSNFYSVLYYNCEIWQIPSLKTNLKRKLLTASAKAIKMCLNYDTSNISYENMHEIVHRSTPENFTSTHWHYTNFIGVITQHLNFVLWTITLFLPQDK